MIRAFSWPADWTLSRSNGRFRIPFRSEDDADFLDKRTAAVLAFGEAQLHLSQLLRPGSGASKRDVAAASLATYEAKRTAVAADTEARAMATASS